MKTAIFALLILGAIQIQAQTTYIPDPDFEQALIDLGIDKDGAINQSVATSAISLRASLSIPGKGIHDLTGIEDFESLQSLVCYQNLLGSLDLSQNMQLYLLECHENQLESLDLPGSPDLISITCFDNQLTSLDVSKNPALVYLWCFENQIGNLDLSHNPALSDLRCNNNLLTNLNLNNTISLSNLLCSNNQLTNLDVSSSTALSELYCAHNLLAALDISQNPGVRWLECNDNLLEIINLKNGNYSSMEYFDARNNPLLCIEVDFDDFNYSAPWVMDYMDFWSEDCGSFQFSKGFVTGWNWFSVNHLNEDMSLGKLFTCSSQGDYIKNQTMSATYYDTHGWYGSLADQGLDPLKLYKIKTIIPCEISYAGTAVNVLSTPIEIVTGWNWIAYLPQCSLGLSLINYALSSLSLEANDYVKNQTESATWYEGHGWYGSLESMEPTEGYMLNKQSADLLTYPDCIPARDNDYDNDGWTEAGGDCDDLDASINPIAPEIPDGKDNDCDGLVDEGLIPEGAVIITEMMIDPAAVADAAGEWFELTNVWTTAVNLHGFVFRDDDFDFHTINEPAGILLEPGGTVLICKESDELLNGGVSCDYEWGDFLLGNSGDEIILEHDGIEIDRIEYKLFSDWPSWLGDAIGLDPSQYNAQYNNLGDNWCGTPLDPLFQLPGGDYGTPGAINPSCSGNPAVVFVSPDNGIETGGETVLITGSGFTTTTSVLFGSLVCSSFTVVDDSHISCVTPALAAGIYDVVVVGGSDQGTLPDGYRYTEEAGSGDAVDWGVLRYPAILSVIAGNPTPLVHGGVRSAGITDEPPGLSPEIIAQLGAGPQNSDPRTTPGWSWYPAGWIPDYGVYDEWACIRTLEFPAPGVYSYTYRFSEDGGYSFTYVDLDPGTADGFDPDNLGIAAIFSGENEAREIKNNAFSERIPAFLPHQFEYNGTVTAKVYMDGFLVGNENDRLMAYVNNELRGVIRGIYFDPAGAYAFPIMVYSNLAEGEELTFRYYSATSDQVYPCDETLVFREDMIVADAFESFNLHVNATTEVNEQEAYPGLSFEAWPNPFNDWVHIRFSIAERSHVRLAVYDMLGKSVAILYDDTCDPGSHSLVWKAGACPEGSYILKLINGLSSQYIKAIKFDEGFYTR